jgi:hypothetical protein
MVGDPSCVALGPEGAVLSPPARAGSGGPGMLAPDDLQLPGGRTAHDFSFTAAAGERLEVERFETLRPDAIIQVPLAVAKSICAEPQAAGGADPAVSSGGSSSAVARHPGRLDVIVERDDRLSSARWIAKLERYDHFLAGWSLHTARYGRRRDALPVVVFVCRDGRHARECARRADMTLRACRAYAGEYPFDWEYPGRERVLFAPERDVHDGSLAAHGVPRLPPAVRVSCAHGDPRAGEATDEPRTLPVERQGM